MVLKNLTEDYFEKFFDITSVTKKLNNRDVITNQDLNLIPSKKKNLMFV